MKTDFEANRDLLNIEDIHSQTICDYFLKLNENNFEEFAALFSPNGLLLPMFCPILNHGETAADRRCSCVGFIKRGNWSIGLVRMVTHGTASN
jgi:hypothetical protein